MKKAPGVTAGAFFDCRPARKKEAPDNAGAFELGRDRFLLLALSLR